MKLGLIVAGTALLSSLFAAGCAGDANPEDEQPIENAEQGLGQSKDVPNPSGAYFASVTANGAGCAPGTWEAAISPDGKSFTMTFSAYEAVVEPGQASSVKDCNLGIDLRTPQGRSFSVSSFHYQGYTLLDQPGMSAAQTVKYYFQGNPVSSKENRSQLLGPFDNSYLFSDRIKLRDRVWSPCGASRRLNALTRLTVRNNDRKTGSGYTNTSAVDAEVAPRKLKFEFGLEWKNC
jgi:hypothetical protein